MHGPTEADLAPGCWIGIPVRGPRAHRGCRIWLGVSLCVTRNPCLGQEEPEDDQGGRAKAWR